MLFEVLYEHDYLRNFSDFKRCEGLWEETDETEARKLIDRAYQISCEVEKKARNYLIWGNALEKLEDGRVLRLPILFIREKNNLKKCPLCGSSIDGVGAISRRDNETEICDDCGFKEAMEDFLGVRE